MNQKEYETEFDRLALEEPVVHAAMYFHERDRAHVDLTLAMKIAVVELARHNARLVEELTKAKMNGPLPPICLCHGEACHKVSRETGT